MSMHWDFMIDVKEDVLVAMGVRLVFWSDVLVAMDVL